MKLSIWEAWIGLTKKSKNSCKITTKQKGLGYIQRSKKCLRCPTMESKSTIKLLKNKIKILVEQHQKESLEILSSKEIPSYSQTVQGKNSRQAQSHKNIKRQKIKRHRWARSIMQYISNVQFLRQTIKRNNKLINQQPRHSQI